MVWFKKEESYMAVLDRFIEQRNLAHDKPLAANTISLYRKILGKFEKWPAFVSIEKTDRDTITEYLNYLKRDYAPMTASVSGTVLKSFFRECVELDIIQVSPMESIRIRRPKVKNKPAFPVELLRKRLLDACVSDHQRLFIYNFSYSGMRIGEASPLKWDVVDFRDRIINVDGKTGPRQIPIHKDYLHILAASKNGSPYFFPRSSNKNEHLGKEYLSRQFKEIATRAGMPQVTSHSIRRSVATHLLRKTGDAKTVAAILGMTVEILLKHYVDSDAERQREVMGLL